ncbi:MAG: efflux RND transporter periplasmic adaptor subunit [Candidatus Stahlbacteria bacterium]|nr:efflux RND transporter periplasmic adaptor subunit [Candidatus Stahlbacteria bacterium]
MKKRKKLFIVIAVIVVIILASVLGKVNKKPVEKLDAITAKKENIVSKVQADGTLKALNQVEIGSDVIGKIVKMKVQEGDKVKKGDVLCIIDQSTYTSRVNQALSGFELAKSQLTKAEADIKRANELFNSQLISKENYEATKLSYETVQSEVKTREEAYNEARATFNKTVITSPIEGEVIQRSKEEGEMSVASTMYTAGAAIMVLGDRSKMFVKALVDETEIVKIKLEQQVQVSIDAFPDTTFAGKVIRIAGIPEASGTGTSEAVNFPIEIEILSAGSEVVMTTPTEFYPGMSASCEIITESKDSVIVIPYTALGRQKIKDKEEDVVILSKGRQAKIAPVRLGLVGEKGVEIRDGINVGDTVLTGPYKKLRELKDGDKVESEFRADSLAGTHKQRGMGVRISRRGRIRI